MQRQKRSELLVAIGVVVALAFAVTFGAVLSVSNDENETVETSTPSPHFDQTQTTPTSSPTILGDEDAQATAIPKPSATQPVMNTKVVIQSSETPERLEASNTPSPMITATNTATATQIPSLSVTSVYTVTQLPVATPSEIPSQSATATIVREQAQVTAIATTEPSDTPTVTLTATNTPTVTLTDTVTSTFTWTPVPTGTPTDTSTPTTTPSETPTTTDTPTRTPSVTSSPTPTMTVSSTSTATFTSTPSFTPTDTATPTASATTTSSPTLAPSLTKTPTRTARPTETNSILPTPTLTPVPSPEPGECQIPAGWRPYEVQPGNTLFSIARAVGTTITELGQANCLSDLDRIFAGVDLFVPQVPEGSKPVVVAPGSSTALSACFTSAIRVTSPLPSSTVPTVFTVNGSINWPTLDYYRVEIRPGSQSTYNFWSRNEQAVTRGQLALIDTSAFGSGVHWIRISIVDERGNVPDGTTCEFPVIFN